MREISRETVERNGQEILLAWIDWNQSDGPYTTWQGSPKKAISEKLYKTIQSRVDNTADGDPERPATVKPEARRGMLCLDSIGREFARWVRGGSTGQSWAEPHGCPELHNAFLRLQTWLTEKKLPPPESMTLLVSLGAPHETIAKKYGWKDESGHPDLTRVHEAIRDPAAFDAAFKPSEWVHPLYATIAADVDREWQGRQPRPKLFQHDTEEVAKPAPPSIETMIESRAPAQQIANVHKISLEEVNELAALKGIDLEAERFVRPATDGGLQQEAQLVAEKRAEAAKASKPARAR